MKKAATRKIKGFLLTILSRFIHDLRNPLIPLTTLKHQARHFVIRLFDFDLIQFEDRDDPILLNFFPRRENDSNVSQGRDAVRLFLSLVAEGNFSNFRFEYESINGGKGWKRNCFRKWEKVFRVGGTHAHTCGYTKKFLIIDEHDHVDDTCYSFPLATPVLRPWISSWLDNSTKLHYKHGGGGK